MSVAAQLDRAITLLQRSQRVVALTGAGISTPSGIPDFRTRHGGLWDTTDPLEVASIDGFRQRPERFYQWLRSVTHTSQGALPNAAHLALANLERHGPLLSIVTQNIDALHQKAGSRRVHELHGTLQQATCLQCQAQTPGDLVFNTFDLSGAAPRCPHCRGLLKPNVILFGEDLPWPIMAAARGDIRLCDLLLIAGTSLQVAPSADLPLFAKQSGSRLIIVNLTATYADPLAEVVIRGDVAQVLPELAAPFVPPT